MASASWGSLSAAVGLVQVNHWFPWLVAFFIVEPIGFASGFAALFLLAPDTAIADWFAFFIKRAKVAMVLLATSCGLAIVIMLVLVACDQSP